MPSGPVPGVAALLLTGGSSRRMGADKTSLRVLGQPVVERLAGLLVAVAGPVLEVGPGCTGLAVAPEPRGGEGPLVALASGRAGLAGLDHHGPALVLACDLPLMSESLLRLLAGWPGGPAGGGPSIVPVVGGRPQPLCSRLSPATLDAAAGLAAGGARSLRALLAAAPVTWLQEPEWGRAATAATFTDTDSPADLDALGLDWSYG